MDTLSVLVDKSWVMVMVGFGLWLLNNAIETFNITAVEKKLQTWTQRVHGVFSILGITTLVYTALFITLILFSDTSSKILNNLNEIITIFVLISVIVLLVYFVTFGIMNLFKVKVKYYVEFDSIYYEIIKNVDGNNILLKANEAYRFVDIDSVRKKEILPNIEDVERYRKSNFHNNNLISIIFKVIIVAMATFLAVFFYGKFGDIISDLIVVLAYTIVIFIIFQSYIARVYGRALKKSIWDERNKEINDKN